MSRHETLTTAPADHRAHDMPRSGKVYLIGAGPGDPDLITVKGLRCLRTADVVIYDRLVDPSLLDESRLDALRIYAGKGPHCHTVAQREINDLLIAHASQGKVVARLKGGDPFVFGRGGEEAIALAEAGILFEIIPGVTSAIAVPAYAGIPVTHRGVAPLFTVVTGHEGVAGSPPIDWEALASVGGTIVILMGVAALPNITRRLIAGGLAPDVPAAVIQQGTTVSQRVVAGTLADIAVLAKDAGLSSPAITVVGTVAGLRDIIAWFDQKEGLTP
jgi:uroporphyrin-III C-methyltransferase